MLIQADETVLRNLIEAAVARSVTAALQRAIEKPLLTTAEVAELFSLSKRTVINWRAKKILPHYRIGGRIIYKRDEVMAFIEHRKVRARETACMTRLSGIKERSLKRIAV